MEGKSRKTINQTVGEKQQEEAAVQITEVFERRAWFTRNKTRRGEHTSGIDHASSNFEGSEGRPRGQRMAKQTLRFCRLAAAADVVHTHLGRLAAVGGARARVAEERVGGARVVGSEEGVQIFLHKHTPSRMHTRK